MSSRPRFLMIAFDITQNHRRYRVVRALRDYGERVQKSVFECWLRPLERRALLARLDRLIDPETDRLHVFELPESDVARIEVLGVGDVTRDSDYLVI